MDCNIQWLLVGVMSPWLKLFSVANRCRSIANLNSIAS